MIYGLLGFVNTLLKVTIDKFPLVKVSLSPGLTAVILTPPLGLLFKINVSSTKAVSWSMASTRTSPDKLISCIIKSARNELEYKFIEADPILSPIFIEEILNEPLSEVKIAWSISTSLLSWLIVIVKSVNASQSESDKSTEKEGEKSVVEKLPPSSHTKEFLLLSDPSAIAKRIWYVCPETKEAAAVNSVVYP